MINKKYKIALITLPVLIGGYFIYRQLRGKKTYEEAVMEADGESTGGSTGGNTGGGSTGGGSTGDPYKLPNFYYKYKVVTLVSNLNVREEPSTTSSIVGSIPKGRIIALKPSSTSGWMSYGENPSNNIVDGYVSAQYVQKCDKTIC